MEERREGARQGLLEAFAGVPDPRSAHGLRHPLSAILALAVCGMLCGTRILSVRAPYPGNTVRGYSVRRPNRQDTCAGFVPLAEGHGAAGATRS